MFPNEARLRNMTYATTLHLDVDVVYKLKNEESIQEISKTLSKIFDIHKYQIVFDLAGEEKQTKDILINLSDGLDPKITASHPNGIVLAIKNDEEQWSSEFLTPFTSYFIIYFVFSSGFVRCLQFF